MPVITQENAWIYVALSLVALAGIIGVVFAIRWRILESKGEYVHAKVDTALRRYGVIRNFKVLKDVTLISGEQSAHVEHALIGFFGILFLTARGETADFYGERKSKDWIMNRKEKKTIVPNLIQKNEDAMTLAREILGTNKVYNIPMEGVVVFSGKRKKTTIYCSDSTILRLGDLKKFLNKAKFDKDREFDVEQVRTLLLAGRTK